MILKNALKIIFHLWDWGKWNFFKGACQISVRKGPNNLFMVTVIIITIIIIIIIIIKKKEPLGYIY